MATSPGDDETRTICVEIVRLVEPENVFVVEENFDDLRRYRQADEPRAEGQFTVPELIPTFAALVVPFLAGFIADTAKDAVKAVIVDRLKAWLRRPSDVTEGAALHAEVLALIDKSKLPKPERDVLVTGFTKLLRATRA